MYTVNVADNVPVNVSFEVMEEMMVCTERRPVGRLCYWIVAVLAGLSLQAGAQGGPATTTVTDTVYRVDGSPAQGNLIIIWPAFVTASGAAVAGGNTSTALNSSGVFSVGLVPNAGATPAGVYYTVVYQLGPGEVKTEYWVVPTSSPAHLAAVRVTPGSGVAGQSVSTQYVNAALATKANDNAVVHLSGSETIGGTKTFSAAPNVPNPTSSGQVANKAYVDGTVECLNASSWAKGPGQGSGVGQ